MKEIRKIIDYLNARTIEYNEGKPTISDEDWDKIYFKLMELERKEGVYYKDSPTQSITYKTVDSLEKVKHNHPMLSLDKTKDWNAFLNYFSTIAPNKDVVGMLKLDGLTCSLRYFNGYLMSAETRGNGEIGEVITHNILSCKGVPRRINYKEELIIDGEIICDTKTFKEKFAKDYKNPRNFAAGSIRLLSARESKERELTFVAWNIVKGFEEENSFINRLTKIEKLGFLITPWTSSFDWDAKEFLIGQAEKMGYPIDGLVGRFDDIEFGKSLGRTSHHEKAAYAFKMYDEEYETTLKNIEYDISRNGEMVPVAIFEPINIDGSEVSRASLHNLSVMENLSEGFERVGDILTIYKANAIIPQVKTWRHEEGELILLPTVCPICGQPTKIKVSESNIKSLWCVNEFCPRRITNKINHFCGKKGLDIKGLSEATIEKLIDWDWIKSPKDIFSLEKYKNLWYNKSGFGEKSVNKILQEIEKSKECELSSFISSLGIPLVGTTVAKDIAKHEFDWHNFREDIAGKFDFTKWDNFGEELKFSILSFDYIEADEITNILHLKNSYYIDKSKSNKEGLNGKTICITGKLNIVKNRAELTKMIEAAGGKVTGSVSRKTSYLITNEESETSKAKAAKEYNIPVINEENFIKKYLT